MRIVPELRGRRGVVLDTMVWIYLLEDVPEHAEAAEVLIESARKGEFGAVMTPITCAELIVKPLKEGRPDIADRYRRMLSALPHLEQAVIDGATGWMAGSLRAKYALPLPDMLQVAVALREVQPTLITHDKALKRVKEAKVLTIVEAVEA